jgi:hypothetical protein
MTPPTDDELRQMWRGAGGEFHGPNVETGTMPEAALLPFLRKLVTVERIASELCDALDAREADIGGHRPPREILAELGPACDRAEGR